VHLENQPPIQHSVCGLNQRHRLSIVDQSDTRFERELRCEFLVGQDVRRIRHNELERPAKAIEQVRLNELDLEREPCCVLARECERISRDVGCCHTRVRPFRRDRERDRTRTRADVDDARRRNSLDARECALDDNLSLRPGHERARVGAQRQLPEAPLAEHVGERLPVAAPLDEGAGRCPLSFGERAVVLGVELDSLQFQRVGEQELRVEPRRIGSLALEVLGCSPEHLTERH
jgi:hypothetical protein